MKIDDCIEAWTEQIPPSHMARDWEEVIQREQRRLSRWFYGNAIMSAICLILGAFNFFGQYFINGDSFASAGLRAVPVLVALTIQIAVFRSSLRRLRDRRNLVENHHEWLNYRIRHLEDQSSPRFEWHFAAFSTLVIALVAASKWIDYRNGEDSLSECVGIGIFVTLIFSSAMIFVHHHRVRFLQPELQRTRRLLVHLIDGT